MAELYSEDAVTHGLHVCLPGWGSVSAGKCANAGYKIMTVLLRKESDHWVCVLASLDRVVRAASSWSDV